MRKNKTFEVNILSEQSSYVQTENASFYTSDTEAFLNFKPADADFNFTSATIALLNRDDSSLVSVDVSAVEGVAEYEMTSEVIAHFGNWVAQVVFKNDNESYTSGLISFDVNRYLMDERPPRLEDVVNWQRLYDNATETINELTRINDELTTTNETVQQAETDRVANEEERELNEAERISKDSERDSKIEEIERVATKPPKPIHTLKVENEVFSSDEVSVSEGVITINNHNLKVSDKVAFVATATSYNVYEPFEGAMRLNTVYYVVNVSSDSFQISTTQSGEPIVFNIDTKGFLWQFEKVSVNSLQVRGLEGTKYRVVFTGTHEGRNLSGRLLNVYTNPGNIVTRYSSEDNVNTITATDINPVHGVIDVYSEMIFKVINRKILITVDSSFTTIGETTGNHSEETYRNRILTRTNNPMVGFQDSINLIGIGGRNLFDGSTLEVYEA